MTDKAILEAAEWARDHCIEGYEIVAVLAAVTPLIEAAALERAAKVAESFAYSEPVAAAIRAIATRALKEQP